MISVQGEYWEETEQGALQSHVLVSFTLFKNGSTLLNPRKLLRIYNVVIKRKNNLLSSCVYENIITNMFLILVSFFNKIQIFTKYHCFFITWGVTIFIQVKKGFIFKNQKYIKKINFWELICFYEIILLSLKLFIEAKNTSKDILWNISYWLESNFLSQFNGVVRRLQIHPT